MPPKPNTSAQARALLAELAVRPRDWQYGYDLLKRTRIKSGTLYPLLIRFHEQGLLDAEWQRAEVDGRPARHAYRLTARGVALAAAQRASATNTVSLTARPVRA